ncbi:hypothetical protein [Kitasatospora herbaricolor]|uniref:hypothetical protein n=1 Tax=Kitasatospora herbaricolor TaxID=68217 RepID=UPI0036DB8514
MNADTGPGPSPSTGFGTGTGTGTVDPDGARRTLRDGAAVVLPNPAPLTYVVAATVPQAVNTAKGRPAGQAVALWAHHPDTLAALDGALDLDPGLTALAGRLLAVERVTLLVPLRPDAHRPDWLSPASRDGWALLFGTRWEPLRPVLDDFPVLYVSSANRTGRPPAAGPAEAVAMFAPATPVLPAVPLAPAGGGPAGAPRAATTTLRLHTDGRLELHRPGAQDRAFPAPERYLDHVREAYGPRAGEGPGPLSG